MNNNKLSTGIKEIDKELSKGSSLEEFVKFHIGSELQPYQKQIVNIIESNENISTEEFAKQYNLNLRKRSNRINILSTPLNGSQNFLDYVKNKTIEINNSLAIPHHLLGKSQNGCIDDGADTVAMILNLQRKRESRKIQIECIKERTPKISFVILDDPYIKKD